jgi:hypothetical protein
MQKFPTGKFHNFPPNMPADMREHETSAGPADGSALKLYGRRMTRKGIPASFVNDRGNAGLPAVIRSEIM